LSEWRAPKAWRVSARPRCSRATPTRPSPRTWEKARALVEAARADSFDLRGALDKLDATHPFLTTAFRTAIEMAANDPRLFLDTPVRVPILGLLQGETPEQMRREADRLVAEGYATVKVKVGFDPATDADVVAMAQLALAGRARIRIDANQGFDAAQAIDFVSRLSSDSIELFEQPCAAGIGMRTCRSSRWRVILAFRSCWTSRSTACARSRRQPGSGGAIHQGEADEVLQPRAAGGGDPRDPRVGHEARARQRRRRGRRLLDGGMHRRAPHRQRGRDERVPQAAGAPAGRRVGVREWRHRDSEGWRPRLDAGRLAKLATSRV
jgi:hypothetical protein